MKKISILIVIIMLFFMLIFIGYSVVSKYQTNIVEKIINPKIDNQEVTVGETLKTDKFDIIAKDAYYADYKFNEDLDFDFDKYLAIDLNIKNNTKKEEKFSALNQTKIMDKEEKFKLLLVDENHKKLGKNLKPNESWDVTIVYPVMESDTYYFYYQDTRQTKDSKNNSIKIDGNSLQTKKVKQVSNHTEIGGENEN